MVQAGKKLRGVAGRCQLSPRTDAAEVGGLRANNMIEINEDTVRAEVRAWLEAYWNPDYGLVEWRLKLAESGWGVPHWPSRWYGRDLPSAWYRWSRRSSSASAPSASPRWGSAPWLLRRSLSMAPTGRRRSSCCAF